MMAIPSNSSKLMWRAASGWAMVLLLGAVSPVYAHHLEKQFTVQSHPLITLHNPSGRVTISSWDKPEVMVVADHDSPKIEVDAEQSGNRVDVVTHQLAEDISPEELRANYVITVPEDSELQIHNDSGAVGVSKILGDMNVEHRGGGGVAKALGVFFFVGPGGAFS